MSILTNNTIAPAQQAANQVIQIAKQQYRSLQQSGLQGYRLIWANPNATPQDVVAALGTNAEIIFALANLNISTITQASDLAQTEAPTLPSVPNTFELAFNPDGSATVTAVTPTES